MNRINIIFLLSILALASACGGKKSLTKANIVLGGLINAIEGQAGGTMIYGRQITRGTDRFAIMLPYAEDLELSNGIWNFAVVSWDGNGASKIMEGVTRCGITEVELLGGVKTIDMTLSEANCKAQFFGDAKSKESSGSPKILVPAGCALTDDKDGRVGSGNCKNSVGVAFTAELLQKLPGGIEAPGLLSRCIVEDSTSSVPQISRSDSQLRVPMLFPDGFDEPLIKLTIYEDSGCSSDPQVTTIANALAGSGSRAIELDNEVTGFTAFNVLFVHNPVCEGSYASAASPFDIHLDATEYIICNTTQFAAINSDVSKKYFLDQDLDYLALGNQASPLISTTFNGTLDGRGRSISNLTFSTTGSTIGIFTNVTGQVRNLNFVDSTITTSATASNIGLLAGNITSGGYVDDIFLKNITVNATGSGTGIGSLTGRLLGGASVHNIIAQNIDVIISGTNSNVGGVIGEVLQASTKAESIMLDDLSVRLGNSTGTCIGGVFGVVTSNTAIAKFVSVTGLDIANATGAMSVAKSKIGGVTGCLEDGAKILSSKVEGLIDTPDSSSVGGIVGYILVDASGDVTIDNVISKVTLINGDLEVGGIVGGIYPMNTYNVTIKFARYLGVGDIICSDYCGGLVGLMDGTGTTNLTINNSWVRDIDIETFASSSYAGGLVGKIYNPVGGTTVSLSKVFADKVNINTNGSSTHQIGGLYGDGVSGVAVTVTDAYFIGDLIQNGGTEGPVTSDPTGDTLSRIYAIVDFDPVGGDDPSIYTGTVINNASASSTPTINVLEDNTTFNTALLVSAGDNSAWEGLADSGVQKTLSFEAPYLAFANTAIGSRLDPYLISSEDAWNEIGDKFEFMGNSFELVADLNFDNGASDSIFNPIGSSASPFWGNLSGNNHFISNIQYTSCGGQPTGIISIISTDDPDADNANDVGVNTRQEDGYLYLVDNLFNCTSGAVGTVAGKIIDRLATPNDQRYGIRMNNISISNSDVSSSSAGGVGGFVGDADINNNGSEIKNIITYGSDITGGATTAAIGGIFGSLISSGSAPTNQGRIESLRSIDNVITASNAATDTGGVFGLFSNIHSEVRKMISTSTVSGDTDVGGIVGSMQRGRLAEGVSKAIVDGATNVGGFVGLLHDDNTGDSSVIAGSYSVAFVDATTNGSSFIGAITTDAGPGPIVTNSWSDGAIANSATQEPPAGLEGSSNLVFVSTVDPADPGTVHTTTSQLQTDEAFYNTNFLSVDPFMFNAGDYPRPYFEVFPQFFAD